MASLSSLFARFFPSSTSGVTADAPPTDSPSRSAGAWLLPGALALVVLMQLMWGALYVQQAVQRHQEDTRAALGRAASLAAAHAALWLASDAGSVGEVEISEPSRRVLAGKGVDIPRPLWFFPPPGEGGLSPAALIPPAPPPPAGQTSRSGYREDAEQATPAEPGNPQEIILLARTRPDHVTQITARPVSGLLETLTAHENPCLRGAVALPTHAGEALFYAAPPPPTLRRTLTQAAPGQDLPFTDAAGTVLPENTVALAEAPLRAAGLEGHSVYAGFAALCPGPTAEQVLGALPPLFWAGQGLGMVALLLVCYALRMARPVCVPGTATLTAETEAARLTRILRSEKARRLHLSGQLITLLEGVRHGLARELHDHIGQRHAALLLRLESPQRPPDAAGLSRLADSTACELRAIQEEVRQLARGLRPPALDVLGLEAALRCLCGEYAAGNEGRPEIRFFADNVPPLDKDRGLALYRVAQEALNNAVRHAGAASIYMSLVARKNALTLTVEDDGRGFAAAPEGGAEPAASGDGTAKPAHAHTPPQAGGLGLSLMSERMAQWGGTLHVDSAVGRGTVVMAQLPLV